MLADPKRPIRVRGSRSGHKEHPPGRHRRRHKSRDEIEIPYGISPASGEGLSSIEHLESTLARMQGEPKQEQPPPTQSPTQAHLLEA